MTLDGAREILAALPVSASWFERGSVLLSRLLPTAERRDGGSVVCVSPSLSAAARAVADKRVACWISAGSSGALERVLPNCVLAVGEGNFRVAIAASHDALARKDAALEWVAWAVPPGDKAVAELVSRVLVSPPSLSSELAERLKRFLGTGGSINGIDRTGQTLLHAAASIDNMELAEWLLKKGASVNAMDNQCWTPLLAALCNGHIRLASFLVSKHADITCKTSNGTTVLHALAKSCEPSQETQRLMAVAVESGVSVDSRTSDGLTPLAVAGQRCRSPGHIETLLSLGADPNIATNAGSKTIQHLQYYNSILNMPEFVLHMVLQEMRPEELRRARAVCKDFFRVAESTRANLMYRQRWRERTTLFKILVIGGISVGKNTLVYSLTGARSAGVATRYFRGQELRLQMDTWLLSTAQITSTEDFEAIIVMYDCTSHRSLETLETALRICGSWNTKDQVLVVVGNKLDQQRPDSIKRQQVIQMIHGMGDRCPTVHAVFEISALRSINVEECLKFLVSKYSSQKEAQHPEIEAYESSTSTSAKKKKDKQCRQQ
eukprot:m51a1_g2268 hypothetical protein (550) ;mRNA; f:350883-353062